jgi:hypothetical protein
MSLEVTELIPPEDFDMDLLADPDDHPLHRPRRVWRVQEGDPPFGMILTLGWDSTAQDALDTFARFTDMGEGWADAPTL